MICRRSGHVVVVVLVALLCASLGFAGGYYYHQWKSSGRTAISAKCLRILDPDTIEVEWKGAKEKVRFAGIDAPEKKEGKKLNDQAKMLKIQAGSLMQVSQLVITELNGRLVGQNVDLVFPTGRVEYDSFGRLLAYIERNGKDVGEMLLRNGLVYPRPEPHPRKEHYAQVNVQAQQQRKGFYGFTRTK